MDAVHRSIMRLFRITHHDWGGGTVIDKSCQP